MATVAAGSGYWRDYTPGLRRIAPLLWYAIVPTLLPLFGYAVAFTGVPTALFGVLYALMQHDLKRLLAYHSVENIGIIALGVGLGLLGIDRALLGSWAERLEPMQGEGGVIPPPPGYLERAYQTARAYFTYPYEILPWYETYKWGCYNELVIVPLAAGGTGHSTRSHASAKPLLAGKA